MLLQARLLAMLPAATVRRFENAGHSIQGDAPIELARVIAQFIAAPAAPTGAGIAQRLSALVSAHAAYVRAAAGDLSPPAAAACALAGVAVIGCGLRLWRKGM